MEQPPELPECPVCLQSYDGECAIPRVLACGHTCCESCLSNLPKTYQDVVRCPACTVLVAYPPLGPSSLPKNIDLLRLVSDRNSGKPARNPVKKTNYFPFFPRSWSGEFYSAWNGYIIKSDAVDREKVSLFSLGSFSCGDDGDDTGFKVSYAVKVMDCLSAMIEEEREELGSLLRVGNRQSGRVCRVLGLFGDLEERVLCLVCERKKNATWLDELDEFNQIEFLSFSMMGMEMCETMIALHEEGLIAGCLGFSCFQVDEFGHFQLDLCRLLKMGKTVHGVVAGTLDSGKRPGHGEVDLLLSDLAKRDAFVSPEVLLELLQNKGSDVESCSLKYSVGFKSDVWLVGCVLLRLLLGEQFNNELVGYVLRSTLTRKEDGLLDCSGHYIPLIEKVKALWCIKFGSEFLLLQQMLCKCLDFDPGDRPLVRNIWKCFKEMVGKTHFDKTIKLNETSYQDKAVQCLVLGQLCCFPQAVIGLQEEEHFERFESHFVRDSDQTGSDKVRQKLVDGLPQGKFKSKVLHGHLDCVTGLAVGGGFLFSSSFDKSIKVWSLQDWTLIHTFKGHENKVIAVFFVDEKKPMCISADSEGGIFVWSMCIPIQQEPLRKWYEQKDWRYSGIHALTVSENGIIYTGSGDRTIKGWSLLDGTLSCTMTGHKSVVSTLAVYNGVLYSGSFDGTIRLWSLSDHSLLTTLGEDRAGTMSPVLSLFVHQEMLVAAYENGSLKIWKNDIFMKTMQIHDGAIFAIGMEENFLYSGGWDKIVNVQELAGDDFELDPRPVGSIACDSVITSLLCHQGKLFVGFADRTIKAYYHGKQSKPRGRGTPVPKKSLWAVSLT